MKKVFDFINSLSSTDLDLFGYPTLKIYSDFVDVVFSTPNVIRNLDFFVDVPCDEFRFYAEDDNLSVVFTFNL